MRTTLSIDDDVAARIEQLRRELRTPLKTLVNEALRRGLAAMRPVRRQREQFRTAAVDLGRCRLSDIDDVAAVLALVEGDGHT